MTSYLIGVITAPDNILTRIIHMAFNRISTAPNYEYIVHFVDKTCKNYRAVLSRLGDSVHGILGEIVPAVIYELKAPGIHFTCHAVLIDNPFILPVTTKQE